MKPVKPGKPAAGGGPLGVLKDKRVMVGAAVAGVLGLVVLLKRGGAPADEGQGGAVLSPAQLDSSGTDLYNALQQFNDGLTDIRDLLDQRPPKGPGSDPEKDKPKPTTPTKPPVSTNPPKPRKPPARPSAAYVTVAKFTSSNPKWNSTLSGIAGHYKTSVSKLLKLNPSIKNANLIRTGQRIRVR